MMRRRSRLLPRRAVRGIAAVEFAIVLPLLALLLFMVVDLSRAIQAKIILLNISREGANLASRATSDLSGTGQSIMNALAASTPPLDMNKRGIGMVAACALAPRVRAGRVCKACHRRGRGG